MLIFSRVSILLLQLGNEAEAQLEPKVGFDMSEPSGPGGDSEIQPPIGYLHMRFLLKKLLSSWLCAHSRMGEGEPRHWGKPGVSLQI